MSKICTIKTKEIVDGRNLMNSNKNLKIWESDLDLLENGEGMFSHCYELTAFSAKTPNLSIGREMFRSIGAEGWTEPTLRTIQMDFDSLTDGYRMFAGCGNIELVSNKTLNGCFDFPLLTNAFEMFSGVSKITVREGGSSESSSIGYMEFPSLTDANHMFQWCKDSYATIYSEMFPKVTNFEGCFQYSYFDSADLAFLSNVGTNPNVTLNCPYMFSYAKIGNYINVDISDNVTNLSDVFINANSMFSGVKIDSPDGVIRCSNGFLSRLKYADYMFANCYVDVAEYLKDCFYLESANEMFRDANFVDNTLSDVRFYSLTSSNSMFRGSNIEQITNFYTINACSRMFNNCKSLTDVDIAFVQLENASYMFSGCSYLINASIKYDPMQSDECDFSYMFDGCNRLQSLSIKSWDDTFVGDEGFPYCKHAPYMFSGCYNLSSDDIVSVVEKIEFLEDAPYMFAESSLTTYPFTNNSDGRQLTYLKNANGMFGYCQNLNIDFGSISDKFPIIENGENMFSYCYNASGRWYTSLPNLTNARRMFKQSSIQYLGGDNGEVLDFSNVSSTYFMFADCVELTDCYMNLGSCEDVLGMFGGCSELQTVKLHNLSPADWGNNQCEKFFNETKLKHASLHNLGSIFGSCDLMFNTRNPLTIELTHDNGYNSSNLTYECTSAYRMFANAAWQTWSDISTFLPLQISGLDTTSDCCHVLLNVSHMFSGRIIKDQQTANNIAGIANYARIATTATSDRGFLGHILVEDKNNLSWFNSWGNWTTINEEQEISNDYMYQTLARTCAGGGQVSMTVYYPKPDPSAQYAIVEGSQYIPDASNWNNDFASSGIVVTSVHDGYAWDDRHMGGSDN